MAKLVQVGIPANDAEKWAFEFLKSELPDSYIIISNVDVYSGQGQPFECDAIIVGEWAVYVIDVKGYQGRLSAGKDVWKHENRFVENPLPKLHQNARILASRCKKKLRHDQHAPWCQGLAFITGGVGGDIIISKGEDALPVYGKNNIVDALTSSEYVAAYHKYKIEGYQKEIALSAICDFKLLRENEQNVGIYSKKKLLSTSGDIELWVVEPEGHTFNFKYWMKYVDISGKSPSRISEIKAQLKKEYYLLSELADLPSVPAALLFHDDGESLALVHQNVIGTPLSRAEDPDLKRTMVDVANTLISMSKRGIQHRALSLDNIYLSDDGKVQLLDVGYATSRETKTLVSASQLENPWLPPEYIREGFYGPSSLSYQFAMVFLPLLSSSPPVSASTLEYVAEGYELDENSVIPSLSEVSHWLANACKVDQDERPDLVDFVDCINGKAKARTVIDDFCFEPGARISDKYELIDCVGRGGTSSIWLAKHLVGDYECCLKILDDFDGADNVAKKEFETLRILHHPNIVRIFDLDIIPRSRHYFLTCAYLEGDTLDSYSFVSVEEGLEYFKHILRAIQYLHRMGLTHKDVKPENIIISSGHASLIDFNLSLLDSTLVGTTRYKDPGVKINGWTQFSDIYSLVLSFSEVLSGRHPYFENDEIPSLDMVPKIIKSGLRLPQHIHTKFDLVLRREVNWDGIQDYCSWFGISDRIEIEVPEILLSRWNVRKGYMLRVLKTMLADMQPRSRQVVIRNTLKANAEVGSSSKRGSISSSISALKSAGVVEYHGKKVRLTQSFVEAWEASQLVNN